MRVTVVGMGYAGLVTALGFAEYGNDVVGLDVDELKIADLNAGSVPFYEPGLPELLHRNRPRIRFTTSARTAVRDPEPADVIFLCVGTPATAAGKANLDHLFAAVDALAPHLEVPQILVVKSTVPPGTCRRVAARLREHACLVPVASAPEFLAEGTAVRDVLQPHRIVLGVDTPAESVAANLFGVRATLELLHRPIVRDPSRIVVMDTRSAELTKYASNAMLATRISFMNELANLCDAIGADIVQVRAGVGMDPRIGDQFLHAGPGFGGSCFPKDIAALIYAAESHNVELRVVPAVLTTNRLQQRVLGEKVAQHFATDGYGGGPGALAGRRIAVWGLAFKPLTDDVRETPAVTLLDQLTAWGAEVAIHDPVATENFLEAFSRRREQIVPCTSALEAAQGADAVVLVTEWREYRRPDLPRLRAAMRTPVLFDGRNVWDPETCRSAGFTYYGMGRR